MLSLAYTLIVCGTLLHAAVLTRPPTLRKQCIRLHSSKVCHYLILTHLAIFGRYKINAAITYLR